MLANIVIILKGITALRSIVETFIEEWYKNQDVQSDKHFRELLAKNARLAKMLSNATTNEERRDVLRESHNIK